MDLEISRWLKSINENYSPSIDKGGIVCNLPLNIGLQLNTCLKIPTRILLRLTTFKARDFPKLYNNFSALPWSKILYDQDLEFKVSCHKSRLIHSGRIASTLDEAIKNYRFNNPAKKSQFKDKLKVYVRFENDQCELSLDTSGEPLYKRGFKKEVGLAPMRETLSAFCLQTMIKHSKIVDAVFLDPMCGSGTNLLEVASINKISKDREYAFYQFRFINKAIPKRLFQAKESPFQKIIGIEENSEVFLQLQKNLSEMSSQIELHHSNFKNVNLSNENNIHCFVNPPYGKRLGLDSKAEEFYQNLLDSLIELYHPYVLGALIPREYKLDLKPRMMKRVVRLACDNGGMAIDYWLWKQEDCD